MSGERGRVVIDEIPDGEARTRVSAFLARVYGNAPEKKIARLISKMPAVVARDIPWDKGMSIARHLDGLGAKARFIPFRQVVQRVGEEKTAPPPVASSASRAPVVGQDLPPLRITHSRGKGARSSSAMARIWIGIICGAILVILGIGLYFRLVGTGQPREWKQEEAHGEFQPVPQTLHVNDVVYALMDDQEKWATMLYSDRDFDAVENRVLSLLREKDDPTRMYELSLLYEALAGVRSSQNVGPMKRVLEEWCARDPQFHVPWLVRGNFHTSYAWHIRGGAYAKDVPKKAWAGFHENLRIAQEHLEESRRLDPHDPNSSCFLIRVAKGLSHPREVMERFFRDAVSASPVHFTAHSQKLEYMKPKWHGSNDEMFAFARQCLESCKQDPYMGLIMVDALDELHRQTDKDACYLGRDDVWPTVQEVYGLFFEKYPDDIRRRFCYAYHATRARKYEVAYQQFELIGDRWVHDTCWSSLDHYNRSRAFVHYKRGEEMLWKVKDRFAATEYFLSSIRCEPTANAFYGLGIAYWQSGHWNQDEARLRDAEAALAKAVELKPDHAQAKEQLARLRQTLKRAAR